MHGVRQVNEWLSRNGGQRDENWPDWYADYMVREQSGKDLPQ
jgi:hypothetical protein